MITSEQIAHITKYVLPLCQEAGQAIMIHYNNSTNLNTQQKTDNTPVTQADIDAHRVIEQGLNLAGSWPVVSEESWPIAYERRKTWPTYWLVDPLDGTKEFIAGRDEFTVNIALVHNHKAVWGAVYAPVSQHMYWGGQGLGAWQRLGPAGVTSPIHAPSLSKRMAQGLPLRIATSMRHGLNKLSTFKEQLDGLYPNLEYTPKGSSLKFCAIAVADADIYPRFGATSEWDTAAGQAVLEGAGGSVINLQGHALTYNNKASIINSEFIAYGGSADDLIKKLVA